MNNENKKTPEHKVKFRDLPTTSIAIWRNTSKDGKSYFNFDLEYSYTDPNGSWQKQRISLLPDEVVKFSRLLDQAYSDFQTLPQFKREPSQPKHAEAA